VLEQTGYLDIKDVLEVSAASALAVAHLFEFVKAKKVQKPAK